MAMTDLRVGDVALMGLQLVQVVEVLDERALVEYYDPETGEWVRHIADDDYLHEWQRRN